MEKKLYSEVLLFAEDFRVFNQRKILVSIQCALDSVERYIKYLNDSHPLDKGSMIESFVCPDNPTIVICAQYYIDDTLVYVGLQEFEYFGD